MSWYDPATRWTEIEPLGPAYWGCGLAHAVVREVIARSSERGARAVMLGSTNRTDAPPAPRRGRALRPVRPKMPRALRLKTRSSRASPRARPRQRNAQERVLGAGR